MTATLHSEQYSSFLALSSSVSGLVGPLEAGAPGAPEPGGLEPACSGLAPPLPQPGEEEDGGIRGGVGVGRRGHTEGTGESMGGVGGVGRGGRGPGARRGPFNCDKGRDSSIKKQRNREGGNQMQRGQEISKDLFSWHINTYNSNNKVFTIDFMALQVCREAKTSSLCHVNHMAPSNEELRQTSRSAEEIRQTHLKGSHAEVFSISDDL